MMANILPITVLLLFLVLAPNLGWGCFVYTPRPSNSHGSGNTVSHSQIDQRNSTNPIYMPISGAVGVDIDFNFRRKREASPVPPSKTTLFIHFDMNKNLQIQLEEWVAANGQIENFGEFLKADDSNGDAQISYEEFQQISGVTVNPH